MWSPTAALSCAVLLAGCTPRPQAQVPEPVTIAYATIPHAGLVNLAAAKGYFTEQGLQVTLVPHVYGKLALAAMLAGEADLATCADVPLVFATFAGAKMGVLATISSNTSNTAVVARRDAGVQLPSDLAGKRVAVPRGTSGEFFLDTLLVRHQVDRRTLRIVDLDPVAAGEALARGEVAAAALWNPHLLALERRMGEGTRTFFAKDIYFEVFSLVGRTDFLEQRPAAARRVLRALLRAEDFIRQRPEEAFRTLAGRQEGGVSSDAEAALREFTFQVRLDQSLLVLLEEQARWAIRNGLVPRQEVPNFLTVLAPEPLREARPQAVGLIR